MEPQSAQRPQSLIFQKTKNRNDRMPISSSLRPPVSLRFVFFFSFWESISFIPRIPAENKIMNKEEAENAELFFRKSLGSFGLPESAGNGPPFSLAPQAFDHFYFCVLRDLCG